ncbi:MAG: hypothetical protein EPO32_12885 [Anaerolineae bacterium]|nr:MAG: hypothetical protein EPO32_12885 [Anaerolineae bacterium]
MSLLRFEEFKALGRRGSAADVDRLMAELAGEHDLATNKLVDYALSLVTTLEGRQRLEHYLFNGEILIQRNFAALYFRRLGRDALVARAHRLGRIDDIQAFAE